MKKQSIINYYSYRIATTVKIFSRPSLLSGTAFMPVKDKLKTKVNSFPEKPGVYFMKDDRNEVIYVGKAKRLRSRVLSYFKHNPDPERLIETNFDGDIPKSPIAFITEHRIRRPIVRVVPGQWGLAVRECFETVAITADV